MLLGIALCCAACAAGPRPQTQSAQRIKDSAPEKVAAQRAASRLDLEGDDERWGLEEARERRKDKKQAAQAQQAAPAPTGPVDLQRPAPPPQAPARP
jgi:hypothetical protein